MSPTERHLKIVERLIIDYKRDRANLDSEEQEVYAGLRALAADLRARLPDGAATALVELSRRMDAALRTKTQLGYGTDALIGLAQELIGRWSVVRQALEAHVGAAEEEETVG